MKQKLYVVLAVLVTGALVGVPGPVLDVLGAERSDVGSASAAEMSAAEAPDPRTAARTGAGISGEITADVAGDDATTVRSVPADAATERTPDEAAVEATADRVPAAPEPSAAPAPATAPAPAPAPEPLPAPAPTLLPEPAPLPAPELATARSTAAPSSSGASALFGALNASRAAAGLPLLGYDAGLEAVAQSWSGSMAASATMAHNPATPAQIPGGWRAWGENVAHAIAFPDLPGTIHASWMDSPGHRANILRDTFTSVGIGYHVDEQGGVWATQVFAVY